MAIQSSDLRLCTFKSGSQMSLRLYSVVYLSIWIETLTIDWRYSNSFKIYFEILKITSVSIISKKYNHLKVISNQMQLIQKGC